MIEQDYFDFPCSYTFREYEAQHHEGINLESIYPRSEIPEYEPMCGIISPLPGVLEQIKATVRHQEIRLRKLERPKKPKSDVY